MPAPPPSVPNGVRIAELVDVDSTNAEALRRAAEGERGPIWLTAEHQTAGRGRSGRTWQGQMGNLFASLLVTLNCPLGLAQQLSLVAGVAAIDAIRRAQGAARLDGLYLKWPNDILIGSEKCGGILIESTGPMADGALVAVIGLGINIAAAPEDTSRPATSLQAHGVVTDRHRFLALLAKSMQDWQITWRDGAGFDLVRDAWQERALPLGTRMSIHSGAERRFGTFAGIDQDGALLLRSDAGAVERFTFGDVNLD